MSAESETPDELNRRLSEIEKRLSSIEDALSENSPSPSTSNVENPTKPQSGNNATHEPDVVPKKVVNVGSPDPEADAGRIKSELTELRQNLRRTAKDEANTSSKPPHTQQTPTSSQQPTDAPRPSKQKPASAPNKIHQPKIPASQTPIKEDTFTRGLRALRLMPPKADSNAEVELASWWATRIGIILGVIGVVFFGVYTAKFITPMIRLAEVSAIAFAILIGGHYLERREKDFGRLVFSAGLALCYFTAYAAYAIPAMKIINSAVLATLVQLATVSAVAACSLWKRSEATATFAVALGFIACIFSFIEGLHTWALLTALLLTLSSSIFQIGKKWWRPVQAAIPLSYLVYVVVGIGEWVLGSAPPSPWTAIFYPLCFMLIFGLSQFVVELHGSRPSNRERKITALMNTTLAVIAGLLIFWLTPELRPLSELFYFTMGITLLIGGVSYTLARKNDPVGELMFVKGTGLITLGLIAYFDGTRRWMSLMIQTVALLWAWRRKARVYIEVPLIVSWLLTFIFFIFELIPQKVDGHTLFSIHGMLSLGFLFISLVVASLYMVKRADGVKHLAGVIGGILLGIASALIIVTYIDTSAQPAALALLALPIFFMAWLMRAWLPVLTATLTLLTGHAYFAFIRANSGQEILNGVTLIAITLICLGAGMAFRQRHEQHKESPGLNFLDYVFHTIWLVNLSFLLCQLFAPPFILFAGTAIGTALLFIYHPRYFPNLPTLAFTPALIGLFHFMVTHGKLLDSGSRLSGQHWLWVAVVSYVLFEAIRNFLPQLTNLKNRPSLRVSSAVVCCATLGVICALAMDSCLRDIEMMAGFAALGLVLPAVMTRFRASGYWYVGLVMTGLAHLGFYCNLLQHMHSLGFVALTICTASATLAFTIIARHSVLGCNNNGYSTLVWITGVAALIMLFTAFALQDYSLNNYVTVLWGVTGIVFFILGLIFKTRPLRMIGLGGLTLCLPRMFLIDINETLYRIIAFCVLSVVLLVIGFLYRKFQDRISGTP